MVSEIAIPAVSVVVFARENVPTLSDSLRSLQRQTRFDDIEVILADGCGGAVLNPIAEQFPWVRRLRLAPGTMPQLKGAAIAAAQGDIVAILDPSDAAEPDWIDEILAGLADPAISAVGGAVLLPTDPDANKFHHGRCFGANRRKFGARDRRLFYRLFAPAVPALLVLRHLLRHMRHPGNRRLLSNGVPALVGICLFWGIGEWLGDWFGPGKSRELLY